jgi:hypothetical protein
MPHEFEARDGDLRSTAFPALVRANGTSIPVSGYAFDATSEEAAVLPVPRLGLHQR